jgi:hypothetical protein
MSKIKKTKYNANLTLDEHCDECNFYEQLTVKERQKYNELQINFLKSLIDKGYEEISLNDFKIDRNHPDRELYRTDSMSNVMSYQWIQGIEDDVEELELKSTESQNLYTLVGEHSERVGK